MLSRGTLEYNRCFLMINEARILLKGPRIIRHILDSNTDTARYTVARMDRFEDQFVISKLKLGGTCTFKDSIYRSFEHT